MTKGAFKKKLAILLLNMAGDYLSEDRKKLLRKVKRISEARASNWSTHVSLGFPPRFWSVDVSTGNSFRREGDYEPVTANYSATGEKNFAECVQFAALADTVAKLVTALQAVVNEYNAEREKAKQGD